MQLNYIDNETLRPRPAARCGVIDPSDSHPIDELKRSNASDIGSTGARHCSPGQEVARQVIEPCAAGNASQAQKIQGWVEIDD